jgi:hypothetical protein
MVNMRSGSAAFVKHLIDKRVRMDLAANLDRMPSGELSVPQSGY